MGTRNIFRHLMLVAAFLFAFLSASSARALTINVTGSDGGAVAQYYWLVEEDATYHVVPGAQDPQSLAFNFHRSYMPVVASGDETTPPTGLVLDPSKHYYVSVLPKSGYALDGAALAPGKTSVSVVVNKYPIPTAQIAVVVFEDNAPINNAPDVPQERGLAGFSVLLFDAGGRYGASGGQMSQDAFGNPFGTTYDGDGNVLAMGGGIISTDANGEALIKYLPPGKYGVQVVPPAGEGWIQTTTLEGTKTIDAWIKPDEPPFFSEFGPPGPHVAVGFIQPLNDVAVLSGVNTISGRIVNLHLSRPPNYSFETGVPFAHTTPWVGLNDLAGGVGRGVYAQPVSDDGTFTIPNVPPGNYQLVVWDENLDLIFAFMGVTIPAAGGNAVLGDIPVFQWFTRLEHHVFYDDNENGFRDPGEAGMPDQAINLRWRDGTIYQTSTTDLEGYLPFDEVFPFFNWLIAEVDYLRHKATGVTVTVDAGGPINMADPWSFNGVLTPQLQPDNGNLQYRTELGAILLEAFQGFIGQTSVMQWGKKAYSPGENGGISGIVFYASTRAENDPRYAVGDFWEPGIPRVRVNLYLDDDADGVIDDLLGGNGPTLADVDHYPFDNFPGSEDVDRDHDGLFDSGDAVQIASTDSWDDSVPTGCPGDPLDPFYQDAKCYDGLRNFNQVRPAVFDGGYAFVDYFPGGRDSGSAEAALSAGTYIVEIVPPRGYHLVKEEDKNVDFGDEYAPSTMNLPPVCAGDQHTVPAQLTLFSGVDAPFAGQSRPLCDRKQVVLNDAQNAAADFFLFTHAPIASHIVGFILDDTANEFNAAAPNFGEKYAPPWLPVSIRDWTGRELSRVYADEYGAYNALVPSTYTANVPIPSGYSPNMVTVALNNPGPVADPAHPGQFVTDPFYNRQYSQFNYTFQYMPGTTTYLDTPVVPVAAFAGPNQFPLDCEYPDKTPKIFSVNGPSGGPYVAAAGEQITIKSENFVRVVNPAYDGPGGTQPSTVLRDYTFGVLKGAVTIGGVPLENVQWSQGTIRATVPVGTATGELVVTRRDNGRPTITGVTVTVGGPSPTRVGAGGSIQAAIDAAAPGDLILIAPGNYQELLVMWKPVKLQGYGEGSTIISAVKTPAEKLVQWRQKVGSLIVSGFVDLLPAQLVGPLEPVTVIGEEGPAILVMAKNALPEDGGFGLVSGAPNARIDGITLTGADQGGGIVVNGYAHYLQISNNRIFGNNGIYGGGIRIGHPLLAEAGGEAYQSGFNDHILIRHNQIKQNGGQNGAGGGLSICTGADNYEVSWNFICGNFTLADGAGIGHLGLSTNSLIAHNTVIFNQSFNQLLPVSGGGILISGGAPLGGAVPSQGSGTVTILANRIQGNLAGAGDGGGIRLNMVNGLDVDASPGDPASWYEVAVLDNIIVNNVAGLAGGGISLQDAAKVSILHNTIANNDSTGTSGEAFTPGIPSQSNTQPAGIVARKHSTALITVLGGGDDFSNPLLANNIIWHNRSFYFLVDTGTNPFSYVLKPDIAGAEPPVYRDLDTLGTAGVMDPRSNILTDATGYDPSNLSLDPLFVGEYVNGARSSIILPEVTTALQVAAAFDEGGNFIDVRFGPLTLAGDYHIKAASPAIDVGSGQFDEAFADLAADFDGQERLIGALDSNDSGADEYHTPNSPPLARNDFVSIRRNVTKVISVLANDADDGIIDPTSVVIVKQPRFGVATVDVLTGAVTYKPKRNFIGMEVFTYTVLDNNVTVSNEARVMVRVLR